MVEDIFAINVTQCVYTSVSIAAVDQITPNANGFIFGQTAV